MPVILVIDRTGSVKELSSKTYEEDNLYKKAGFKTPNDFQMHHVFEVNMNNNRSYRVRLYGKTKGKSGQENKYDFPPPVDNVLFFGSCLLVNVDGDECATNLSLAEWKQIYDKLFGGFEELDDNDTEDELDLESDELIDPSVPLTKEGYVKDDFIVDDDDADETEEEDDEPSEEEDEPSEEEEEKKSKPLKKKTVAKTKTKAKTPTVPKDKKPPAVKRTPANASANASANATANAGKSKSKRAAVDTTYITSRSEEVLDTLPILQDELEEDAYFV